MATITFKGNPVKTSGTLPAEGTMAPSFSLVKSDLTSFSLADAAGKNVILNIFPSLDTSVCAASVRKFNELAAGKADTLVLAISKDLPFAHSRFCSTEGIKNVITLSGFRDKEFGKSYGVEMTDGPLAGLYSRCVVVIDKSGIVKYTEQVPEIVQEPDYEKALAALL
ncbi:MAG: thiol peroxidase [Bacteroidales bacterium]|nr:thiol peroxidase [Bacteroidales bacterium]